VTLVEIEMLEKEAGAFESIAGGFRGAKRGFRGAKNVVGDRFNDALNLAARGKEKLRHRITPPSFSENIKHTRNKAAQALKEQKQKAFRFNRDASNTIRDKVEDLDLGRKAYKASLDTSRFINNATKKVRNFNVRDAARDKLRDAPNIMARGWENVRHTLTPKSHLEEMRHLRAVKEQAIREVKQKSSREIRDIIEKSKKAKNKYYSDHGLNT